VITLLAVVLAGIAVRLWTARREPADRLRRARRSAHLAGFPKVRPEVEAPTVLPATGTVRDPFAGTARDLPVRAARDSFARTGRGLSTGAARDPAAGTARGPFAGMVHDPEGRRRPSRGEIAAALAVGLAAFLAVGGLPGAVVGATGSGIALAVLRRRESPELREERRRLTADLPLAADLMVACLRAGQPITGAVDVTAEAIAGPLGERLAWVSGQLRLGAAPESAWPVP
jgi:Flp pilus assembly protein TadB